MRFNELSVQSVPYQETLNPFLWANNQLKTEIRYQLMLIARNFIEFLKVQSLHLKDITISGSNASYGYSEFSDIDLHLIVDIPSDKLELIELYDAKKNQFNFTYDIKVKGIDVELYVQDSKQHHESAGIYSVINDKWIKEPKHQPPRVSEQEVNEKALLKQIKNFFEIYNPNEFAQNIQQYNKENSWENFVSKMLEFSARLK
jgi:hypothetical protein